MRWNLRVLRSKCEQHLGHPLPYRQIEEETRISKSTLTGIINNKTERVDFKTVDTLLGYFSKKMGRQLELTDILQYEPNAEQN